MDLFKLGSQRNLRVCLIGTLCFTVEEKSREELQVIVHIPGYCVN